MPAHGVPSALNTGGSLPDLSSLHFPSPLPTPLDQDEPAFPGSSSLSGGSSTGNLASTLTQLGINAASAQGGNGNFHHHSQGTCSVTDHTALRETTPLQTFDQTPPGQCQECQQRSGLVGCRPSFAPPTLLSESEGSYWTGGHEVDLTQNSVLNQGSR